MVEEGFLTRLFSVFGFGQQAAEAASAEPRQHHYYFAHGYLPELARTNAKALVGKLLSDSPAGYLHSLWEESGNEINAAAEEVIATGELVSIPIAMDSRHYGVMVQLPRPERTLEAYFAAIIVDASSSLPDRYRYFTLELSDDPDGGTGTVLCEWDADRHINYGIGCTPDHGAFAQLVARILSDDDQPDRS